MDIFIIGVTNTSLYVEADLAQNVKFIHCHNNYCKNLLFIVMIDEFTHG